MPLLRAPSRVLFGTRNTLYGEPHFLHSLHLLCVGLVLRWPQFISARRMGNPGPLPYLRGLSGISETPKLVQDCAFLLDGGAVQ
jgi:hypothetical protein